MKKELNGLLSGKYDSTKQRAVLLSGDRKRNYLSYTLTMRMELLLTGQLIFTDAQFFDGLYFHWLAKDASEFEAFKTMMTPFDESLRGRYPLYSVAIKCRPQSGDDDYTLPLDLDQVATKMYCKQFQFSSIEEDNLARAVFDISSDYDERFCVGFTNKGGKQEEVTQTVLAPEHSLKEYIDKMQERLDACYEKGSSISEGWAEYTKQLVKLYDIAPNKWGYLTSKGKWVARFLLDKFLDQTYPKDIQCTYREEMQKLIESAEQEMKTPAATRHFARIYGEIMRNIGNRSKITVALEELEKLNRKDEAIFQTGAEQRTEESKQTVESNFRIIRQLMNDRYNKALAYQHGCRFLDMCDYIGMDTKRDKERNAAKIPGITLAIPEELIAPLAEMSWADFKKCLDEHKGDLEMSFNCWMTAYMEYTADDPSAVEESLKQYLTVLKKAILVAPSSAHTEPSKPWDEFGITDETIRSVLADTYDHPYYFVGGGSFEASAPGNEICILCVDEDAADGKGLMIFRLRLGSDSPKDSALDTLLAPVCNPLNGGALPPVV